MAILIEYLWKKKTLFHVEASDNDHDKENNFQHVLSLKSMAEKKRIHNIGIKQSIPSQYTKKKYMKSKLESVHPFKFIILYQFENVCTVSQKTTARSCVC